MNSLHVIIAGGSGLIGSRLSELLLAAGFRVSHLGRHQLKQSGIGFYQWNPAKESINPKAISEADYIINLAGDSIAGKRWTTKQKIKIIDSRVKSARLLQKSITEIPNNIKAVVCASAVGYYGNRNEIVDEQSVKGKGFLADVVEEWENANNHYPVRTIIFRLGNVLSQQGGVLKELIKPLRFFVNPILGSGRQMFPWIHIDDLCNMIIYALSENKMSGTYNAVAPTIVTQKEFMLSLKKIKHSYALNIKVPELFLKLLLGEQAAIVLEGANVSSEKIQQQGFVFHYPELKEALKELV